MNFSQIPKGPQPPYVRAYGATLGAAGIPAVSSEKQKKYATQSRNKMLMAYGVPIAVGYLAFRGMNFPPVKAALWTAGIALAANTFMFVKAYK